MNEQEIPNLPDSPEPEPVATEVPAPDPNIKAVQTWRDWWPGRMGMASREMAMSGASSVVFQGMSLREASDHMNTWFNAHPGLLVVSHYVAAVPGMVEIMAIYSKQISPEQEAEYNEIEREVQELIEKRRADNAKAEAERELVLKKTEREAAAKAKQQEKENQRLIELGRSHEKNCKKDKKGK